MLLNTIGTISTRDVLEVVIICIPIIVTVYYNNYRMRKQSETEMRKKADVDYVNQQDRALHHRIDDSNKTRENDMSEIREGMREIRQYILKK